MRYFTIYWQLIAILDPLSLIDCNVIAILKMLLIKLQLLYNNIIVIVIKFVALYNSILSIQEWKLKRILLGVLYTCTSKKSGYLYSNFKTHYNHYDNHINFMLSRMLFINWLFLERLFFSSVAKTHFYFNRK